MLSVVVIPLALSHLFLVPLANADCVINPFADKAPLLIEADTTNIIYPTNNDGTVKFAKDDKVDFVCPGAKVQLNTTLAEQVVQASCVNDTTFLVNKASYSWGNISCTETYLSTTKDNKTNCTGGKEVEIGFDIDDKRFIPVFSVCYDPDNQTALYAKYEIRNSIRAQVNGNSPSWKQDDGFYDVGDTTVDELYKQAVQQVTINRQLGISDTNTTYIKPNSAYVLSRGHLAARADFTYSAEQDATYRFINAAPQWQIFNGNNWKQIEEASRNLTRDANVTLQVWTGIFSATSLPDKTGQDVPLYLFKKESNGAIPVPAVFWKILYNPESKEGVGLLGVNNPYEANDGKYAICKDISGSLKWLNWKISDLTEGYSYACSVGDMGRVIPYVPDLNVTRVLGSSASKTGVGFLCFLVLISLIQIS